MRQRRLPALLLAALLTAGCGDGTGPTPGLHLSTRQPADGADDASVAGVITARFDKAVTLPADTTRLFWLERDGQAVPGLVSRPDNRTLQLAPYDVLDPAARYVVHIGEGLADAAGATLPATTWTFTTDGDPLPLLQADRALAHVAVLAHDSMRGRRYGTVDEVRAAQYVQQQFQSYSLTPYASGQWQQPFTFGSGYASQNVVATLPGTGTLRSEWIVVGAHYDHVGVSATTGQVYNGADDNASGTATMLEIARTLAGMAKAEGFGSPNRRSILFAAFGAEEAGLLGSNYFCAHPLVALSNVVAMINLDMVGRLRSNTLTTIGQNTAVEWSALLARYGSGFNIITMADAGTDYRCFKTNGRPVMALYTGTHPEYHRPEDDVALINSAGMAAVGTLALDLAINLSVRPRTLTPPAAPAVAAAK